MITQLQSHIPTLQEVDQPRSLPVGMNILISLTVITATKPMHKGDVPLEDPSLKSRSPLSSAPPTNLNNVHFYLSMAAPATVNEMQELIQTNNTPLGRFGLRSSIAAQNKIVVTHEEPQWMLDTKSGKKGKWRRQARYKTFIKLNCFSISHVPMLDCKVWFHNIHTE